MPLKGHFDRNCWQHQTLSLYKYIIKYTHFSIYFFHFAFSPLQVSSTCAVLGQHSSEMTVCWQYNLTFFFVNLHFNSFLACSNYSHGKKLSSKSIFSLIYRIRNVSQSCNEVNFKSCGNCTTLFSFLSTDTRLVWGHMTFNSNVECNFPPKEVQVMLLK